MFNFKLKFNVRIDIGRIRRTQGEPRNDTLAL
jgi:hypothetical protein